jgi:putative DNA primase/helicase
MNGSGIAERNNRTLVRVLEGFPYGEKIMDLDGREIPLEPGDTVTLSEYVASVGIDRGYFQQIQFPVRLMPINGLNITCATERVEKELADLDIQSSEREYNSRHQLDVMFQCRDYNRTDLGNSQRFVERYGYKAHYCFPFELWFIWNGRKWEMDQHGQSIELGKETVNFIGDEAGKHETETERSHHFKWAGISQSAPRINAMLSLARSSLAIGINELDSNPNLISFTNGVLELDTMTFREHRRTDMNTMMMGCGFLPEEKCPKWEWFLDEIFNGNNELIRFVQRALGYTLTASTKERAIFLCWGSGANGKSTLLGTISEVMGDYSKRTESSSFTLQKHEKVRNDLAALKGARFVVASEAGKGRRLDEELIKQLSGGEDTISARFLFKEFFEYKPEFKIWWAFNHKPRVEDSTNSIWDRVKLIPFGITIPQDKRDRSLSDKLRAELPGIAVWMLKGFQEYKEIGLNEPDMVQLATREYREEQDRLSGFLTEKCELDPNAWSAAFDLWIAYLEWCNDNKEQPISKRSFWFELVERYKREVDRATKKKGYIGIKLKNHNHL